MGFIEWWEDQKNFDCKGVTYDNTQQLEKVSASYGFSWGAQIERQDIKEIVEKSFSDGANKSAVMGRILSALKERGSHES